MKEGITKLSNRPLERVRQMSKRRIVYAINEQIVYGMSLAYSVWQPHSRRIKQRMRQISSILTPLMLTGSLMKSVLSLCFCIALLGAFSMAGGCGGSAEVDLTSEIPAQTAEEIAAQDAYEKELAARPAKDR